MFHWNFRSHFCVASQFNFNKKITEKECSNSERRQIWRQRRFQVKGEEGGGGIWGRTMGKYFAIMLRTVGWLMPKRSFEIHWVLCQARHSEQKTVVSSSFTQSVWMIHTAAKRPIAGPWKSYVHSPQVPTLTVSQYFLDSTARKEKNAGQSWVFRLRWNEKLKNHLLS